MYSNIVQDFAEEASCSKGHASIIQIIAELYLICM